MHEVLCHEWLFFSSRDDLESLQLVRKSLCKTIVGRSNVLSLRTIHRVNVNYTDPLDKIEIFVDDDRYNAELIPDYETSVHSGDFAGAFHRLQNAFIKNFWIGISDYPFMRYLAAQKPADFTSTVVSIDFDPLGTPDYDLLDSVMNLVRPRTRDVDLDDSSRWDDAVAGQNSKYLELLARDSFLNHLQICPFNLWRDYFPPPSFFLKEPGYPHYKLTCYHTNVADGIDAFIESFVRDGCANRKLKSVCITWTGARGVHRHAAPPMPKLLVEPTKSDKPLPTAEAEMARSIRGTHRVSQCEMNVFENKKQQKQMEVHKWSVEHVEYDDDDGGDPYHLHPVDFGRYTAYVLQCLVKNI